MHSWAPDDSEVGAGERAPVRACSAEGHYNIYIYIYIYICVCVYII